MNIGETRRCAVNIFIVVDTFIADVIREVIKIRETCDPLSDQKSPFNVFDSTIVEKNLLSEFTDNCIITNSLFSLVVLPFIWQIWHFFSSWNYYWHYWPSYSYYC